MENQKKFVSLKQVFRLMKERDYVSHVKPHLELNLQPAKQKTGIILNKNHKNYNRNYQQTETHILERETNCQNDQEFLCLWNEEINTNVQCSAGMSLGQQYLYF